MAEFYKNCIIFISTFFLLCENSIGATASPDHDRGYNVLFEESHRFPNKSAMADIADTIRLFMMTDPDDLDTHFNMPKIQNILKILAGEVHGIRADKPSPEEIRYMLLIIAVVGQVYENPIHMLPVNLEILPKDKREQWISLYVFVLTFQEMNHLNGLNRQLSDLEIATIDRTISSELT